MFDCPRLTHSKVELHCLALAKLVPELVRDDLVCFHLDLFNVGVGRGHLGCREDADGHLVVLLLRQRAKELRRGRAAE